MQDKKYVQRLCKATTGSFLFFCFPMPFDYRTARDAFKATRKSKLCAALSDARRLNEQQQKKLSAATVSLTERCPRVDRVELNNYATSYAQKFPLRYGANCQQQQHPSSTGRGQAHRFMTTRLVAPPIKAPIGQEDFHRRVATFCKSIDLAAVPPCLSNDAEYCAMMVGAYKAAVVAAVYSSVEIMEPPSPSTRS